MDLCSLVAELVRRRPVLLQLLLGPSRRRRANDSERTLRSGPRTLNGGTGRVLLLLAIEALVRVERYARMKTRRLFSCRASRRRSALLVAHICSSLSLYEESSRVVARKMPEWCLLSGIIVVQRCQLRYVDEAARHILNSSTLTSIVI